MVRLKRATALLLMTILIMTNAVVAYAGEADDTGIIVETREGKEESLEKKKEDEPVAETSQVATTVTTATENGTVIEEIEDTDEDGDDISDVSNNGSIVADALIESKVLLKEQPLEEQNKALDVCFYIRGNGIDHSIPREPASHPSAHYSAPIRINGAIEPSDLTFSSSEVDGSEENLLSDHYTAANGVTAMISKLPSAEDIQAVVPDFDPNTHYVVWYVVKSASTGGSNWDVNIHVDGVIRTRQNAIDIEHYRKLDELESHLQFIVVPKLLDENGRSISEIEYDGLPHMVGGFDIEVVDTWENENGESHETITSFIYDCLSKFMGVKTVYAGDEKTEFEYAGEKFYLNITSVYTYVTTELEDLHFYRGSEEVDPASITVTDIRGASSAMGVYVDYTRNLQSHGNNNIFDTKNKDLAITIKAGSTVKNYDGTTLTNDDYFISGGSLAEGDSIQSVTIVGSQTGIGYSPNEITNVVIVNKSGKDVTSKYNITCVNGRLIAVDGSGKGSSKNKSSEYTSSGTSDETGARYTPSTSNTAKKSTTEIINGRVARAKITHADGSVTYINVPFETSYGNDLSDNQPQVLGARRAATDDPTNEMIFRIMIILLLIGVMIQALQKNNNSPAIS